MNKIKVLHVTQALGGVKTYISVILSNIKKDDFDITLVAPYDEELKQLCNKKGFSYIELNFKRQINPIHDLYCFSKLLAIIRKFKPNIIHAHSAKGGMLSKLTALFHDVPIIFTPNAFSYLSFVGFKRTIFYTLEYLSRKRVNKLMAVSYSEYDRAIHELRYNKEQVAVVLNSINTNGSPFHRDFNKCFTIGMIGRLTYQKNPLLFLEIVKRIKETYPFIQFKLLGAGYHDHLKKDVLKFIDQNGLDNIQILSWGEFDIEKFYKELDIFVLTSAFEGLPFSLLEAMKYKLPCVVTNVDGSKDVIKNNENGFTTSSLDEMIAKIIKLIESKELRERIGNAAYNYVNEHHNSDINIKRVEKVYRNLV